MVPVRERERGKDSLRTTLDVLLKQLKNSQHDVIDIAEARGLTLLGVMEATGPVDGYVCLLLVQLHSSSCTKEPVGSGVHTYMYYYVRSRPTSVGLYVCVLPYAILPKQSKAHLQILQLRADRTHTFHQTLDNLHQH